jgi:hypothetical protein
MVLVSLAKVDNYYTVNGKMLLLESKKWIPEFEGQPDMDGITYNLGGSYELTWANGLVQTVPADTHLIPYSLFGGKRKTKSKKASRRKKTHGRRRRHITRRVR